MIGKERRRKHDELPKVCKVLEGLVAQVYGRITGSKCDEWLHAVSNQRLKTLLNLSVYAKESVLYSCDAKRSG